MFCKAIRVIGWFEVWLFFIYFLTVKHQWRSSWLQKCESSVDHLPLFGRHHCLLSACSPLCHQTLEACWTRKEQTTGIVKKTKATKTDNSQHQLHLTHTGLLFYWKHNVCYKQSRSNFIWLNSTIEWHVNEGLKVYFQ